MKLPLGCRQGHHQWHKLAGNFVSKNVRGEVEARVGLLPPGGGEWWDMSYQRARGDSSRPARSVNGAHQHFRSYKKEHIHRKWLPWFQRLIQEAWYVYLLLKLAIILIVCSLYWVGGGHQVKAVKALICHAIKSDLQHLWEVVATKMKAWCFLSKTSIRQ